MHETPESDNERSTIRVPPSISAQSKTNPLDWDGLPAAEAVTLAPPNTGGSGAPGASTAPPPPGYQILGELGRGGMGVVYKARHLRLNRLVALKMILSGPHAGTQELERFRREAEAAASLQHANIVQIYEVGETEGRPYLSMEYVADGSLADKLDGTPQAARPAARLVETLARAVHEAHKRGIIHRDLKPANVLLQIQAPSSQKDQPASGNTPSSVIFHSAIPKITDFGLAKRVADAAGPSQSGAVMGTPSYMAPEQAAGEGKRTGPPTDVYALGAILYELVTGRPPFRASTPIDTVLQVLAEDPVAPSRLQPRLAPDLETICLKCLQKDPRRRYGSAEELAEDLRRFLADEPILARPIGRGERTVKWARRRPALAGLIAVSFVAAVALLTLGVAYQLRIWRSNAELAAALAEARREHERAQSHLNKALEVVDQMMAHVGNARTTNTPEMLDLRRRLLKEAHNYYEWSLERENQDPAVRWETARACLRTAELHLWLGETAPAEARGKEALTLLRGLVAEYPDQADYRYDLGRTFGHLGRASSMTQRFDQAQENYQEALASAEKLVGEYPDVPRYLELLVESSTWLGLSSSYANPQRAEANIRKAVEYGERLVASHPQVADYQGLLASAYGHLAAALTRSTHPQGAEGLVRKGLALLEPVDRPPPRDYHDYIPALGALKYYEGVIHLRNNRLAEGESSLTRGIALLEQFVQSNPVFHWRMQLAMSYPILGEFYTQTKRPALAEEAHRKGLQSVEQLARDFPSLEFLKTFVVDRRILLMIYAARRGEHIDQTLGEAEKLAQHKGLSLATTYNLACVYALAVAAQPTDHASADRYGQRAMELLQRVEKGGFFRSPRGVNLLKTDADLHSLRQRPDFQALLERVKNQAAKSQTS